MPILKVPKSPVRLNFGRLPVIAGMMVVFFLAGYSFNRVSPSERASRKLSIASSMTTTTTEKSERREIRNTSNTQHDLYALPQEIFRGSKLRGFHKKSILALERISPSTFPARNQIYHRWLERCKQGNCKDHLELAFPTCKAVINHHYKFIWLRSTKVGGTSLREPLGFACDDEFALEGLDVNKTYCGVNLFTNATIEQVSKWWKEYFVFDIIRNPYIRFASGEEYLTPKVRDQCGKTLTFGEVCESPYLHTYYCLTHECCENDIEHHFLHMTTQSQCLFDTNLNLVVDYLGETETLQEDTKIIISEINKRRDLALPPLKPVVRERNVHRTKRDGLVQRSYIIDLYENNEHCLKNVGSFFSRDFVLLGYEKLDTLYGNMTTT